MDERPPFTPGLWFYHTWQRSALSDLLLQFVESDAASITDTHPTQVTVEAHRRRFECCIYGGNPRAVRALRKNS